ncbi:MAG TPA: hypothetical protein VF604_03725 [Pyrinomonadaceae bacterium]|jgi:hypothetical protein
MKITTFLITLLVNTSIGFFLFFMLLLAMNGFHENDATPGLLLYIVWGLLTAVITGVLGALLANYLATKKALNKILATIISSLIFVIAGGVSIIVGAFGAVLLASALK